MPYFALFSHSTSITDRRTNGQTEDNHDNSSTVTKLAYGRLKIEE